MTPRNKLSAWTTPSKTTHAGLWLDKYIGDQKKAKDAPTAEAETRKKEPKTLLIDQVAHLDGSPEYKAFFSRWQLALEAWRAARPGDDLLLAQARVRGRMVVGLGAESVVETSLRLHHTYGVPYIPGSALKGLARAYARDHLESSHWGCDTEAFKVMFGIAPQPGDHSDEESEEARSASFGAGFVTFFDALYVPGSGMEGRPLRADVLTVHHKSYYGGAGTPPADWDNPTPAPFLTATGAYLIALGGPGDWPLAAYQILEKACAELGVGAKTAAGYGRLALSRNLAEPKPQTVARRVTPRPDAARGVTRLRSTETKVNAPQSETPRASLATQPARPSAPQTVFPNAIPLPVEAAVRVPPVTDALKWQRGTVLVWKPYNKQGTLRDDVNGEELTFTDAGFVEPDLKLRKDLPVEYAVDETRGQRLIRVRAVA